MHFSAVLAALGFAALATAQTPTSSSVQGTPSDIPVPAACVSTCQLIKDTMGPCDYNPTAAAPDTKCACTDAAYSSILSCYSCLAYLGPNQVSYLQSNLDNYLRQCRTAPVNPVNLANSTVTVPASAPPTPSATGAASASATSRAVAPATIAAASTPAAVAPVVASANNAAVADVSSASVAVAGAGVASASGVIPNTQASTTARSAAGKAWSMEASAWAGVGMALVGGLLGVAL